MGKESRMTYFYSLELPAIFFVTKNMEKFYKHFMNHGKDIFCFSEQIVLSLVQLKLKNTEYRSNIIINLISHRFRILEISKLLLRCNNSLYFLQFLSIYFSSVEFGTH